MQADFCFRLDQSLSIVLMQVRSDRVGSLTETHNAARYRPIYLLRQSRNHLTRGCAGDSDEGADDVAKILVIDDEPEIVQALTMRLRNRGYEVISALDGKQGARLAASELPDLIILDINMPGLSGHDVARQLQSSMRTLMIPIIFLTAQNSMENYVEAFRQGAVKYITKPFEPRELEKTIQLTLECCSENPRNRKSAQ